MQINVLGYPDSSAQYFSQADNPINQGLALGRFWYKPIQLIFENSRSSIIKTQLVVQDTENSPAEPSPNPLLFKGSTNANNYYAIKRHKNLESLQAECSLVKFLNEAENSTEYVISLLAIFTLAGTQNRPYASLHPLYKTDLYEFIISQKKRLSLTKTFDVLSQLLEILLFLQRHHVVHQDIKPENLFIKDMNLNKIILGDFELGFMEDVEGYEISPRLRSKKYIDCGTPGYASPERLCRKHELVNYKSDIWGAACVVATIYTKRTIFSSKIATTALSHEIRLGQSYLDSFNMRLTQNLCDEIDTRSLHELLLDVCEQNKEPIADIYPLSALLRKMFIFHPKARISAQDARTELHYFQQPVERFSKKTN